MNVFLFMREWIHHDLYSRFDLPGLRLHSRSRSHPLCDQTASILSKVVAINTFGLVVVGGDSAFHLLTIKQIEEQDNCSKQVNIASL